jgi:hypothetical protein
VGIGKKAKSSSGKKTEEAHPTREGKNINIK